MRKLSLSRGVITAVLGATAALLVTSVHADHFPSAKAPQHVGGEPSLTRAEVLADLKLYQESGLAVADRVHAESGIESAELHAARQRYSQWRHGERYAALVAEIAQRHGLPVRFPRGA